ncbi:VWA domain-containing protein [Streptomyces sp. RS10V-4]|uniref:VWA domain-containing protein n=1 Tax=Streptomyces rhizoryzae TaxID=2932493 RepID=UPI0020037F0C|nr:VWA domain-containing protein [Streptomyces rhizoryzae]MCK7623825.1 VWA domain-containing protein [Streptomyces rhizoryzae]
MGIRSLLRNAFGRSKAARDESGAARTSADQPESATIPEAREESAPAAATAPPEAEVPAARTAPTESAEPAEPAPAPPVTASLPAQSSPVEPAPEPAARPEESAVAEAPLRNEPSAAAPADTAPEPVTAPEPKEPAAAESRSEDAGKDAQPDRAAAVEAQPLAEEPASQAVTAPEPAPAVTPEDEPKQAPEAPTEAAPTQTPAPAATDSAAESATDSAADLVSRAFDHPAPAAAPAASEESTESTEPKAEAQPEKAEETGAPAAAESAPAADTAKPETAEPEGAEPEEPAAQEAAAAATAAPAPAAGTPNPVAATAPGLLPLYDAARATLEKHHLTTQRATVYLVLDRSGSMRTYYKDGTVQHLAEQALALSAHFDENATVPVVFFSTDVDGTADLDLTHYEGRIEELHSGLGHMGRTNYHWAIEAVVAHYKKSGSTGPAFVIFQTDGAPTSKPAAERALCEAAGLPVFWQFIGFGDPEAKGFDFLRKLDDLTVPEKRVVDNAGFFHAGRDPRSLSHEEFFQQLMVEFPEWLAEARAAKVLKDS